MPLDILIEALLFYKSAPQKKSTLMKLFAVGEDEFQSALSALSERLKVGAIRLVETDTSIQLVTTPELSEFVETLRKKDLSGDISKAGAETLSVILYREPVSRAEIDRIRGVNSSFILRNLLTRGLVVREAKGSGYEFSISTKLLTHLGVSQKQDLPEFAEIMNEIETFETNQS